MVERLPRLLYVDDESFNLELFQLTFFGKVEVIIASSASDAFIIMKNDLEIDLVIADQEMPKISGLEFIKQAKLIYKNTPFYILSGHDFQEECKKRLDFVSGFFQKPFNRAEILSLCISQYRK